MKVMWGVGTYTKIQTALDWLACNTSWVFCDLQYKIQILYPQHSGSSCLVPAVSPPKSLSSESPGAKFHAQCSPNSPTPWHLVGLISERQEQQVGRWGRQNLYSSGPLPARMWFDITVFFYQRPQPPQRSSPDSHSSPWSHSDSRPSGLGRVTPLAVAHPRVLHHSLLLPFNPTQTLQKSPSFKHF